jgi:GAF domain-containing protein/DNA-binding response OmpR family regulator
LGIEFVKLDNDRPALCWMGVPILLGENVLGAIALQSIETPRLYDEHQMNLLTAIASPAAIAIQNARLFQQTQIRAEELSILNEMGRALAASLDLKSITENIYQYASRLLDTSSFFIAYYDRDQDEVSFPLIYEQGNPVSMAPIRAGNGLTQYVIRKGEPVLIEDSSPEKMKELGIALIGSPSKCWLGIPMMVGSQPVGVISVESYTNPHAFDLHARNLLISIASQAAIAIQNARLFQETTQRNEELGVINEIIGLASRTLDLQQILDVVFEKTMSISAMDGGLISLFNPISQKLELITARGLPEKMEAKLRGGFGGTLCEYVYECKEVVTLEDMTKYAPINVEGVLAAGFQAYLGLPLLSRNEVVGTICFFKEQPLKIQPSMTSLLQTIGNQIGFAIENARLFQETTERNKELGTLNDIVGSASQSLDLKNVLEIVLTKTLETIGFDGGLITIYNQQREKLERIVRMGLPGEIPPDPAEGMEDSLCNVVFTTKNTLALGDLREGAPIDVSGEIEAGFFAYIGAPLESKGQVLGTICGYRKFPGPISQTSINLIQTVGRQIGFSIENAGLFNQIRRQNEFLGISAEIGRLVTSTLELNTLFTRTVNLIHDRFGFYHAAIFIVEETGFNAILTAATGEAGAKMLQRGHSLAVGSQSVVGTVTSAGTPMIVNDTANEPTHLFNPLLPDTRSEATIPLRIGRRIIGALDIQSTTINAFTQDIIDVLQALADQIAVAIDNARSYELAQQAIAEMRELDRLKDQFLANMSHELRTPLNSIIGFSRVILKGIDGPVTELQEQDLNAIYNSGQHLLRLINDILDLSKIQAGKMELAFDDVNLSELLQSVIPTAAGLIKDKPIQLIQNIAPDIPIIRADSMRIRQVVLNLLANAAKFTEEGSITVGAGVEMNKEGQPEAVVKVTDTGPGISQEDQKKLFQAFSQVDASPTRKTGGSGLGLSICLRLIELHGGHIGVNSEPGKGSTFYFTLPLPKIKESNPNINIQPGDKVILAVDDDAQVIGLYERYLHPQGYQVIALTDPTQTIERANQLKPYAITLDIMMPGKDGWSVLQELKNNPDTRDIPVIVCSILEEEERGFSLGASDYLVKPILEEDLLKALDRLNGDGKIRDVLVIDDNPKDLRLIEKILKADDRYHPICAKSGPEGWKKLSENPPHAVVLDLFMPDMDGFAILEKLRTTPDLNDIPVLVVSGVDLSAEQKKQLADFGQKLLQKGSLNEEEMLSLLDRALRRIKRP